MVDCSREDMRDLLPDLVHDQLGPAERVRVEQHLAECADCARELELLRSLRVTAFVTPDVNVDRIAATVRASMASSGTAAPHESDVVPIDEARGRVGGAAGAGGHLAGAAHGGGATRDATRRTARVGIPPGWRIAAGIALVAAGAGGYLLTKGGVPSLQRRAERAAMVAVEPSTSAAAPAAGASGGAAKAAAPAPAPTPAAPMVASDMAEGAAGDANGGATPAAPLILGDALNELSESDMQALLQSVDDLEAMPELEPHQLPLLAGVVEGAL